MTRRHQVLVREPHAVDLRLHASAVRALDVGMLSESVRHRILAVVGEREFDLEALGGQDERVRDAFVVERQLVVPAAELKSPVLDAIGIGDQRPAGEVIRFVARLLRRAANTCFGAPPFRRCSKLATAPPSSGQISVEKAPSSREMRCFGGSKPLNTGRAVVAVIVVKWQRYHPYGAMIYSRVRDALRAVGAGCIRRLFSS